jgi:hypothetical protein
MTLADWNIFHSCVENSPFCVFAMRHRSKLQVRLRKKDPPPFQDGVPRLAPRQEAAGRDQEQPLPMAMAATGVVTLAGMGNNKMLLAARIDENPSPQFPDKNADLSLAIVEDFIRQQPRGHRTQLAWDKLLKKLAEQASTLQGQGPGGKAAGGQPAAGLDALSSSKIHSHAQALVTEYIEKQIAINNEGHKHAACRDEMATHWAVAKGLEGEVKSIAGIAGFTCLLNDQERKRVIPKKSLGTYIKSLVIRVSGIPDGAPASQIRGHILGLWRKYKEEAYKDGRSVERKVVEDVLKSGKREVTKLALNGAKDLLHMLATGKVVDGQRDFVVDYV